MAVIKPTQTTVGVGGDGSSVLFVWTPVTESDTCAAIAMPRHSDKSIHASGTFGGATVAVQGSNIAAGTTFAALNNAATGTPVALTVEGINTILENTVQIKPVMTGGSGQSLILSMLVHLANPLRT